MGRRASIRAIGFLLVSVFAFAGAVPSSAQFYEPLLFAYGELTRPVTWMRGKMNPYVDRKTDFFGGVDASKATTSAWIGVTWAPLGMLAEDGWRLRLIGDAGRYTYRNSALPGGVNDASRFSGEALAGYRKTFENVFGQKLYAGVFVGPHYEDLLLALEDGSNPARGSELGIKGTFELYSRIYERYIASAFGSLSSVHEKYHAKATLLYELNEMWALGGEIAALGDARHNEERVGLAGTLTWQKRVFALSAGVLENSGRGDGTYLSFSVYTPF